MAYAFRSVQRWLTSLWSFIRPWGKIRHSIVNHTASQVDAVTTRDSQSGNRRSMRNEGLVLGHGLVIEVGSENFIARRPQVLNEQKQKRLLRPPGVYTWRQG
jgi:hypothetical protein